MAKIYDNPNLIGVLRLNEDVWFKIQQTMLLRMANTDEGKDLLCIPKHYNNIFKFGKNHVFCNLRMENGVYKYDWDFRVGAKWANVIRYRWKEFQEMAVYFQDAIPFKPVTLVGVRARYAFGGPYYPDPNVESTSVDGFTDSNSGTPAVWATKRSETGANADDTSIQAAGPLLNASATDQQWGQHRRIFTLFDTSAIPDGDTISAATLSLYGEASSIDNFSQSVTIAKPTTASNTALATGDHNISGWDTTQQNSSDITIAAWATSAYNDFALAAAGIGNISKTGITKFGAMLSGDRTNTEPTYAASTNALVRISMADTAGTTQDPKLTGTSATAATKKLTSLLLGV